MTARMDTIVQSFSIDVGFGDVIVPQPAHLDYPLLIEGLPAVNVEAYSLETVVAEKFQTMIDRGTINSRMKDFFDVYTIPVSSKRTLISQIERIETKGRCESICPFAVYMNFVKKGVEMMWVTYQREMKVKAELDRLGIENFVPMRYNGSLLMPFFNTME